MKYAMRYTPHKKQEYLAAAGEIIIPCGKPDAAVTDVVEKYLDHRITLAVPMDNLEATVLFTKGLIKTYGTTSFCLRLKELPTIEQRKIIGDIPFYITEPIRNWEEGRQLRDAGVSDVFVAEQLGFEAVRVSNFFHSAGINIRFYPNVAQSAVSSTAAMQRFFIRPEDLEVYAPYFDIAEFWGPDDRQDTLYRVYAIDQSWAGELKDLIVGLKSDLDGRFLIPGFAAARLNCCRRCLSENGCKICQNAEDLARHMKEHGFTFSSLEK